jgi:hypothetical protein
MASARDRRRRVSGTINATDWKSVLSGMALLSQLEMRSKTIHCDGLTIGLVAMDISIKFFI